MIKAIIFDVDNTLIDFIQMKDMGIQAAANAMIDAGLTHKKEAITKRLWELLDIHGYEDQTVFQRYLREAEGTVNHRILANAINAYRRVRIGFLEPFPHVNSTLHKLSSQGITLAVVTDAPRLKAWLRLTAMKIDHFFDHVIAFEDTKTRKPSKKPFLVALKKLGLKAEECLMVGDMPQRDIKGAHSLGIKTCFARYGNLQVKGKTEADYEIKDIQELLDIVKR